MKIIKRLAALLFALILMISSAQAEWKAAGKNNRRFLQLLDLLAESAEEAALPDAEALNAKLEEIRAVSEDDYDIARAITDHWNGTVLDPEYRMFTYRDEERAFALEQSGLDFSGKHAFVVLGYKLRDGEMTEELTGRCNAAGAAAVSFPDAIIITTGGATGKNNPNNHTEAGRMEKYLKENWLIDSARIFTEKKAQTTLGNAVNSFRIMKAHNIETYTIITSYYHQLWAQVVFNAQAAIYEKQTGYRARMVGNYNYMAGRDTSPVSYARTGLSQLASLFGK